MTWYDPESPEDTAVILMIRMADGVYHEELCFERIVEGPVGDNFVFSGGDVKVHMPRKAAEILLAKQ